jgi:SAM-dependent MidA family methyltransferase
MEGEVHCHGDNSPLEWQWTSPAKDIADLPRDLPIGYTTEIHPAAHAWMAEVSQQPWLRAMIIADYGYEADEYYQAERSNGTLRRYVQHRSDTEVLQGLGECDLTSHINFTPLIEVAVERGFAIRRFMDQGRFLTHAAAGWLRSLEGRAPDASMRALLRQFQTLTHPQHMGTAFRVLQLERLP